MKTKPEVSKAQIDRDAIAGKAWEAIHETKTGARAASVLINIMKNDAFDEKQAREKRISDGPATARQVNAVFALLKARKYSMIAYQDILGALKYPDKLKRYINNIPRKEALTFVNATPAERMAEMFCSDTRTDSEKQVDAEMIQTIF